MSQLNELVDLPDPALQPLVHPLDLAGARHLFRTSWLIDMLTSPAVGLGVAAIIWFLSRSYVVPLVAGAVIVLAGTFASHFYRGEAWAFIPRKRQDHGRPLPRAWELASGLLLASLLVVDVALIGLRLGQSDIPREVREFTFGMAIGAAVVLALDLIARVRLHAGGRTILSTLPVLVALVASSAIGYNALFGASGLASPALVLWGAAAMLAVGAGYAVWRQIEGRRGVDGA